MSCLTSCLNAHKDIPVCDMIPDSSDDIDKKVVQQIKRDSVHANMYRPIEREDVIDPPGNELHSSRARNEARPERGTRQSHDSLSDRGISQLR